MDGHGQPALLYIVPFTLGKFTNFDNLKILIHLYVLIFCVAMDTCKQNKEQTICVKGI